MQTRSTSTNTSSDNTSSSSNAARENDVTGEDAVRRAASAVINRSAEGDGKRVRRRSRKARNTPLLDGGGLKFHYVVGGLLAVSVLVLLFRTRISNGLQKLLHPPAPAGAAGAAVGGHVGPPPWWFHPEIIFLLLALVVWLYLTPGVWDQMKVALGLQKDKEQRSRRRHN